MVRLTDRPDMTLDVYRERKTTMQQQPLQEAYFFLRRIGTLSGEANLPFSFLLPF